MSERKDVLLQVLRVSVGEIVCTALMLGVYALLDRLDAKVLWGALLGSVLAILNFFMLSITVTRATERAVETGDAQKAKRSIQSSSVFRLLAIAVILILVLRAGLCDPLAAILPLLFLQVSINLMEFFRRGGEKKK